MKMLPIFLLYLCSWMVYSVNHFAHSSRAELSRLLKCWDLIIAVMSQWAPWRLKSPAFWMFAQPFAQPHIKENTKLRVTGVCEGNPSLTGGFPSQMASNTEMFPFYCVIILYCHFYHQSIINFTRFGYDLILSLWNDSLYLPGAVISGIRPKTPTMYVA